MLETLSLLLLGMSFFDAITHSFATVATGGFSPRNTSIGFFSSPAIEIVIMVFMILSGIHFALIFWPSPFEWTDSGNRRSSAITFMGNVGPGFGMVSSLSNFSQIQDLGKWILSIVMLLGRLEILALLMFLFYKALR